MGKNAFPKRASHCLFGMKNRNEKSCFHKKQTFHAAAKRKGETPQKNGNSMQKFLLAGRRIWYYN